MAEGFLLGPDLLARTRRTIETVEGGVAGSGFRAIPTVLEGETPTNLVPHQLVISCRVTTNVEGVKPGHVVSISPSAFHYEYAIPQLADQESTDPNRIRRISAEVYRPATFVQYQNAATAQLGVIVGGAVMPTPSSPAVVRVCIAGLCIARVRPRFTGSYLTMQGSVKRSSGDTDELLTGAAEAASCGRHRILSYLNQANSLVSFAVVVL